jgi:hypothetical protein
MGLRLKNKMEEFFDSISDGEKSRNGKLRTQIKFLKNFLGTFGDLEVGKAQDELIKKYFNVQLRNEFGQGRY